jgi:hypothetical protein
MPSVQTQKLHKINLVSCAQQGRRMGEEEKEHKKKRSADLFRFINPIYE